MSYLSSSLRLHFAGQFQATVSTVNNDVKHFNNATFHPNFQERGQGATNGWWNPDGDGVWRLLGCDITSAFMKDGTAVTGSDPVTGYNIADSDNSAPAKIVDLDPQQQLVSTIFGLTVRIADANGNTLMSGDFAPAAFTELWNKIWSGSAGGDMAYGAMWQSVIQVNEWGDISSSPFLTELKASSDANQGLLSVKFNVDLFSLSWPVEGGSENNNFCRGRIVGTIGPATQSEPKHFVAGRQFFPTLTNEAAILNYCSAIVDTSNSVIRLDLGNALPVNGEGNIVPIGDIYLNLTTNPNTNPQTVNIGKLSQANYTTERWYENTAAIIEIPYTDQELNDIQSTPLSLSICDEKAPAVVQEMTNGQYVRADLFVFRLSQGVSDTVNFYATEFGKPCPAADIEFFSNPSQLQGPPAPPNTAPGTLTPGGSPFVSAPANGVTYPSSVTTDASGRAYITLTGGDTKSFRDYIDGQLYGVGYGLKSQNFQAGTGALQNLANIDGILANPWNFVSVLVFDPFTADSPPTWYGSMETIFQQYANLYPVMARFVDLGNFEQVKSYAGMLIHAFSLPDRDPNAMPVTRDLSPAKRAAILTWLKNPLEGTQPSAEPTSQPSPSNSSGDTSALESIQGGKAAALAKRNCKL